MLNEEELGYEVEYTLDYEYRFYEAKVLKVERARGKQDFDVCEILCPLCGDIHHHGYDAKEERGHRVPHCFKKQDFGEGVIARYYIPGGLLRGYGCPTPQFVLYRFYDADYELLYIGQTISPRTRFKDHAITKDWWEDVAKIELVRFNGPIELSQAEIRAIKTEKPKYNVMHNKQGVLK